MLLAAGSMLLWWWLGTGSVEPAPDAAAGAAPTPSLSSPPQVPAAAAVAEPAPSTVPPAPEVPAAQRQERKITRGLALRPAGGLQVDSLPPGSVAGALRLQVGDAILSVNGEPVSSLEQFARIYREQGLPRQVTIIRDGKELHRH
jgi:membrane-associated protease RseP (regulator of RpoE activity)